ncbi:MAG: ABC transporter ATP-binding protein [Betaproteobacteria bacterium]|nr:ABC transporter ATP-binding protein [Betaproteobacteria bacterium]
MRHDASDCLLAVKGITVRFGGIVALDGVSFDVPRNKVCGLIGPNGAGKTTLFNCLSRLYAYQEGDLIFEGRSITETPVHRMAYIGIGRTFQNLAMFRTMSVRHNVMVGAHARSSSGFLANMLKLGQVKEEEAQMNQRADEVMKYLKLTEVEFGRALASQPKLLLLDEPAAGLNHEELHDLGELIKDVRDRMGITVLLVEHHMSLVMSISDWIVALNFGKKIAEGTPEQIQKHPEVIRAYLGGEAV